MATPQELATFWTKLATNDNGFKFANINTYYDGSDEWIEFNDPIVKHKDNMPTLNSNMAHYKVNPPKDNQYSGGTF